MATLPGLGYAVTYPFGVVGIILVMLGVRFVFRVSLGRETDELESSLASETAPVKRANLEVANPNLVGLPLEKVPMLSGSTLVVSRIWHDGALHVPRPDTKLELGDVLLAVGPPDELDALRVVVGKESDLDLRTMPSAITSKRLIVTRTESSGKTLAELDFIRRFGVQITRISRAEVEMSTSPAYEVQYGDTVLAVGDSGEHREGGGRARRLSQEPQLPPPHSRVPGDRSRNLRGELALLPPRGAGPRPPRPGRGAAAGRHRPQPGRAPRATGLVHASLGELDAPRDRHRPLPGRGGAPGGRPVRGDAGRRPRPLLDGLGSGHHPRAPARGLLRRAGPARSQLPHPVRAPGGEHDRSRRPCPSPTT